MAHPPFWEIVTLLMMGGLGYFGSRLGLLRGFVFFVNVLLAGLLAFNFWEPLAELLAALSPRLDGVADALCLSMLFAGAFGLLLLAAYFWVPGGLGFPSWLNRAGGAVAGVASGYLVGGILLCLVQTLPLGRTFLGYDSDQAIGLGAPDRTWLALVHRASGDVFDYSGGYVRLFDWDGSFVQRYARYRRTRAEQPEVNRGEFPASLPVRRPNEPNEQEEIPSSP